MSTQSSNLQPDPTPKEKGVIHQSIKKVEDTVSDMKKTAKPSFWVLQASFLLFASCFGIFFNHILEGNGAIILRLICFAALLAAFLLIRHKAKDKGMPFLLPWIFVWAAFIAFVIRDYQEEIFSTPKMALAATSSPAKEPNMMTKIASSPALTSNLDEVVELKKQLAESKDENSRLKIQDADLQRQMTDLQGQVKAVQDMNGVLLRSKSTQPATTNNAIAPNGIAPINPNGGNYTVNNFGKPKWDMTDAQLSSLTKNIQPFAKYINRGNLITCIMGDTDGTLFAEKISNALKRAGADKVEYVQAAYVRGLPTGIIILLHTVESRPPGFTVLVQALNDAGITPIAQPDEKTPENEFAVIIGTVASP